MCSTEAQVSRMTDSSNSRLSRSKTTCCSCPQFQLTKLVTRNARIHSRRLIVRRNDNMCQSLTRKCSSCLTILTWRSNCKTQTWTKPAKTPAHPANRPWISKLTFPRKRRRLYLRKLPKKSTLPERLTSKWSPSKKAFSLLYLHRQSCFLRSLFSVSLPLCLETDLSSQTQHTSTLKITN